MAWRQWSVIVVLILANYIVFSILGTLLFPVPSPTPPAHVPKPTFTPAATLQRVGTLSYDFLTPSPTPTDTCTPTVAGTPPTATVTPRTMMPPRTTALPTHAP